MNRVICACELFQFRGWFTLCLSTICFFSACRTENQKNRVYYHGWKASEEHSHLEWLTSSGFKVSLLCLRCTTWSLCHLPKPLCCLVNNPHISIKALKNEFPFSGNLNGPLWERKLLQTQRFAACKNIFDPTQNIFDRLCNEPNARRSLWKAFDWEPFSITNLLCWGNVFCQTHRGKIEQGGKK